MSIVKESKIANGRIGVHVPGHPGTNNRGYIPRARYVMEQYLGRLLDSDEHVHHCNHDKIDDVIENLELVFNKEHMRQHNNLKRERVLDYEKIAEIRKQNGWGYKKISKYLGYSKYSVKSAIRIMERGYK